MVGDQPFAQPVAMGRAQRLKFFQKGEQLPGGCARRPARFQFRDDVALACNMQIAFRDPELGLRKMCL
jgi:hypothetical protein